ncbi:hypothetical protein WH158_07280 [Gluconobacter cerinus]|uniref:hypothetical protein n=1 Tax=Gluconobacter cerinus TaxID=38307 RepID=UPI0030A7AF4D
MNLSPVEVRLRLSIMDLIRDGRTTLAEAQTTLYLDDPKLVAEVRQTVMESLWAQSWRIMGKASAGDDLPVLNEPDGALSKKHKHRSAHPKPQRRERGLTVSQMATEASLWTAKGPDKTTLYRLLEAHGWLKRAPFGREQSRWFVSDEAVKEGYGQTVDPSNLHSIKLSGGRKSFPFPVFYEDKVKDVVWTLGWDIILKAVDAMEGKKARLAWLMDHHSYLPNKTIADLSGVNVRTVERAKA